MDWNDSTVPRKLPASYVRKLNEEQKLARSIERKRRSEKEQPHDPDSGKLKGFSMVCQICGTLAHFAVDAHGYATCKNCGAIAPFRLGHVA